jgi:3'-5' exoribonuclease
MLVVRSADNFSIAKDENENDYILTVIPNTEEIIAKLRAHIVGIKNKHLKGMCIDVLKRDGLFDKFSVHPAAESKHHAEKHGLLYHECRMMDAAAALCDVYGPDIDKDVVITAILFHDIGKLLELDASPSGAGVYTKYAMLGHIFLGANMVSEYHSAGMITDEEWMQVSHCILAHHGTKEWGSPVEPMTKEALLVHHVDNLDAKMFTMENVDLHMEPGEFTSRAYAYGGKYAYKPLALNQMPKESAGEK